MRISLGISDFQIGIGPFASAGNSPGISRIRLTEECDHVGCGLPFPLLKVALLSTECPIHALGLGQLLVTAAFSLTFSLGITR